MAFTPAEKYLPKLDEVYKATSKTAVLDMAAEKYSFDGAETIHIYNIDTTGLGEYDRAAGFPKGTANGTWEDLKMKQDRGASFTIDAVDNEDSLNMAVASTSGSIVREHEVPEVDAYRFATYATKAIAAGNSAKADISSSTDVLALIDAAQAAMGDKEVPTEGKFLFVSETAYAALKKNITRTLANENGVSRIVETLDGMPVIRVPQGRFNTAIDLNDGSSAWGFAPKAGGFKINFMIVHPSAVIQVLKHRKFRRFLPDQNIDADAYKIDLRVVHDAFVKAKKADGIYVHTANTANT